MAMLSLANSFLSLRRCFLFFIWNIQTNYFKVNATLKLYSLKIDGIFKDRGRTEVVLSLTNDLADCLGFSNCLFISFNIKVSLDSVALIRREIMGGGRLDRVSLFETSSKQWQEQNLAVFFYLFLDLVKEMEWEEWEKREVLMFFVSW